MKWVIDTTGRFRWRPYYDREELDIECEWIITKYLEQKYVACRFPISTDDLCVMIERDTSDLDLYADLSGAGEDIEGLTDFFPDKKPAVRIARELSLESRRYNRLRTTLAHEYGHVKFHTFLWEYYQNRRPVPDTGTKLAIQRRKYSNFHNKYVYKHPETGPRCKRSSLLDAPVSDWMEWQASYAGGAFLIPLSKVRKLFESTIKERYGLSWIPDDSEQATELAGKVAEAFDVSTNAAMVRLTRLGFLQEIHREENTTSNTALSPVSF